MKPVLIIPHNAEVEIGADGRVRVMFANGERLTVRAKAPWRLVIGQTKTLGRWLEARL